VSADAVHLLRTAALLGERLSVTDLSVVARRPVSAPAASLQEAVTAGIVDGAGCRPGVPASADLACAVREHAGGAARQGGAGTRGLRRSHPARCAAAVRCGAADAGLTKAVAVPGRVRVGDWIRERRLQKCRDALARPAGQFTAISDLARQWGFRNAPSFARSFRAALGMSRREWRNATAAVSA
jgi:AraC-like DNA-binding protein